VLITLHDARSGKLADSEVIRAYTRARARARTRISNPRRGSFRWPSSGFIIARVFSVTCWHRRREKCYLGASKMRERGIPSLPSSSASQPCMVEGSGLRGPGRRRRSPGRGFTRYKTSRRGGGNSTATTIGCRAHRATSRLRPRRGCNVAVSEDR